MINANNASPTVKRDSIALSRDTTRVVARPLVFADTVRIPILIERILALTDLQASELIDKVQSEFSHRHVDLKDILLNHYQIVSKYVPTNRTVDEKRKLLIGSYFTMEYSIESAALFNPSIVLHPDQSQLPEGAIRFVMSLRATGEGHISSIVFRTGTIDRNNNIVFDEISRFATLPKVRLKSLDKDSDYTMQFLSSQKISERVIFPQLASESKGIEDARFVRFVDENNTVTYYGTYTAYDGFEILPKLIETKDFLSFSIITLKGDAVKNKGLGMFPRKIDGQYCMLSRQDGVNNRIMFSKDLYTWNETELLQEPEYPWEFVQIGNCGSPIETSKGWLVLTHGVGPMRKYSIGAILLDLKNPRKVIAVLESPLLSPNEDEREGYVPNVVYSCGSLIHHETLILPYAMSDIKSGMATVQLDELIGCMKSC